MKPKVRKIQMELIRLKQKLARLKGNKIAAIQIRCTHEQCMDVRRQAKKHDLSISDYCMQKLGYKLKNED